MEALEARVLLSSISGSLFNGLNGSGVRASNDPSLAGWTVYIDQNNTGQLQAGDPSATTGSDGAYQLNGLPLDTSLPLRVASPAGWAPSTEAASFTLTDSVPDVTGVDLGQWQPISDVAASALSSSSVHLAWNRNAYDSGVSILRSTDGVSFSGIAGLYNNQTSFNDGNLTAATHYWYEVQPLNVTGVNGAEVITPPTDAYTSPNPPSALSATATSANQVDLSWNNDSNSAYQQVRVLRSTNGTDYGSVATLGATATGYSDTGLNEGTHYYYEIEAQGPGGARR